MLKGKLWHGWCLFSWFFFVCDWKRCIDLCNQVTNGSISFGASSISFGASLLSLKANSVSFKAMLHAQPLCRTSSEESWGKKGETFGQLHWISSDEKRRDRNTRFQSLFFVPIAQFLIIPEIISVNTNHFHKIINYGQCSLYSVESFEHKLKSHSNVNV